MEQEPGALRAITAARAALTSQCGFVVGVHWLANLAALVAADIEAAKAEALSEHRQVVDTDMPAGSVLVVRGGGK